MAGEKAQKKRGEKRSPARKQKAKGPLQSRMPTVLSVAALVGLVFICYANSLANDFVFDDDLLVFKNRRIASFSEFVNFVVSYRPLRHLSYALDRVIWGNNPFGFHLTNLFIHAGCSVMAFFLARKITGKPIVALAAAAIFVVHPIQTDAVTYVSGRRDVLFTLFYLAAFLSYIKYHATHRRAHLAGFIGFWLMSLMSKEMAVSLPLVIFVWSFCDSWDEQLAGWTRRAWKATRQAFVRDRWLYIALVALGVVYAWYYIIIKKSSGRVTGEGIHFWGGSFFSNVLMAIRVQAWYLKQLIFPTPIAQYYGAFDISHSLLDARVLLSFAVVASVIVGGFALLKKNKLMAFAVLSYFAMLAPVSQIIPHHEMVADHYLYLPIFSFALFVALAVDRVARNSVEARRYAYAAITVAVIVFSVMTISRNRDWKNDLTLWQANYESVPNSPRAAYNLGGRYLRSDPARAEALFKQALASDPNFEFSYLALARLCLSQKRIAEAEEFIQKGLELADSDAGSHILRTKNNLRSQLITLLAATRWERGQRDKTEELLIEAINLHPENLEPRLSLASLYRPTNREKEIETLKEAIRANPSSYEARARLVSALFEEKRYDEGRRYVAELYEMIPSPFESKTAIPHLTSARAAIARIVGMRDADEQLQKLIERNRD